jgi:hypothetical protein
MLYTVAEISELIGLSKVSIYNKLKLKELEGHIVKNAGTTYIDEDGLNLIREGLKLKNEVKTDLNREKNETVESKDIEEKTDDLSIKTNYLKYLEEENKRLWDELGEKNIQISNMSRLVENGQILLKDKKQQELLALEKHFDEIDSKLLQIKDRMKSKKESKGILKFLNLKKD